MADGYLLGVVLAILGGVVNQLGAVFQKKVVNDVPKEAREERFMRTLIRSPLWITGLIFIMVLSAIFFLTDLFLRASLYNSPLGARIIGRSGINLKFFNSKGRKVKVGYQKLFK